MGQFKELCRQADQWFFRAVLNTQGGCAMNQTTVESVINGVNVKQLGQTISAIKGTPSLARSQFRARNRWINGGHNQTTIQDFYTAGQEQTSRTKPFVIDADEPPVLLGEDHGATAVEAVLHALAACLTGNLVYHAAARGIRLEAVESTLEGDLDLQGFLGLSETVRRGFEQIRVSFRVKSDATAEQLTELCRFSPVLDIVSNPVPVSITVTTA